LGSVEGLVNGEVFNWTVTGLVLPQYGLNPPSHSVNGEATVNGDELNGRFTGGSCPCTLFLHRVGSDAIRGDAIKGTETR
jgi:hypothetical protein